MVDIEIQHEAEGMAARFLVHRGYEIVARRWQCPSGTADIIARNGDELVFAEVVANCGAHPAAKPLGSEKRSQFEAVPAAFCRRDDAECIPLRFDEISIAIYPDSNRAMIRHHINALG